MNTIKLIFTVIIAVAFSIFSCEKDTTTPTVSGQDELGLAIDKANKDAQDAGANNIKLRRSHFEVWFTQFAQFDPLKKDRKALKDAVAAGKLPGGTTLAFQDNTADGFPSAILFQPYNLSVAEENQALTYLEFMESLMITSTGSLELTKEPYQGVLPSTQAPVLGNDIQIKVTAIEVQGSCLVPGFEERDALKVEVLANAANVESIADWFGTGFDKAGMQNRISELLNGQSEAWIEVQQFFPNWLRDKINTFPVDGDNEVCHGAAREFYYVEQESSLNASTEATILMLNNYYCEFSETDALVFGDYLYVPGQHSGRFLLTDPASGRGIGFSVQSGGIGSYRFWWVDEDFSGNPFGNQADVDVRKTRVDAWRRCKY